MRATRVFILCIMFLLASGAGAAAQVETGFQQASPRFEMQFPRDHGSHPDFQTEWWYYTGQLVGPSKELFRDGADFGFQLTFFRRAERAADQLPWDQSYLAHAALLDVRKGEFHSAKRLAGGGLGVAGAAVDVLRVWNRDWKVESIGLSHVLRFTLEQSQISMRLDAKPSAAPVLHGDKGFSRKGRCATCASQYYSLPGMRIEGEITIAGKIIPVQGLVWMDHEFMSNALQADQAGWDWFSLMFKDGRRLMLYKVRDQSGGISFASGTLVSAHTVQTLAPEEFSIEELSRWRSPGGTSYPSSWRVRVPGAEIDEIVSPLFANQEIVSRGHEGISYWEGAVASASGIALGYVEMTGYERALGAKF